MNQELRIIVRADGTAQVVGNFESVNSAMIKTANVSKSTFATMRDNIAMTGLAINGIKTAFNAISGLSGMFTQPAAEIEQLRLRLWALYGSAERGAVAFDVFEKAAAKTPATLLQVVNAGAQLKAFGLDAENTIDAVSDLAAFMGVDIVEAANSMGRAFAGGAGAADIFRERGILNVIRDFNKLDDLTSLTLPEFREAMISTFTDAESPIRGAAARMANSYTGALSNMQDAMTRFKASIGNTIIPALTEMFKSATLVADALAKIDTNTIKSTMAIVGINAVAIGLIATLNKLKAAQMAYYIANGVMLTSTVALGNVVTALKVKFWALHAAMGKVGLVIMAISVAISASIVVYNKLSKSKEKTKQATDELTVATKKANTELAASAVTVDNLIAHYENLDKSIDKATGTQQLSYIAQAIKEINDALYSPSGANLSGKDRANYVNQLIELGKQSDNVRRQMQKGISSGSVIDPDAAKRLVDYNKQLVDNDKKTQDEMLKNHEARILKEQELRMQDIEKAKQHQNDLLSAQLAYLQAVKPLSDERLNYELMNYASELENYKYLGFSKLQIDEMIAAKRKEIEQQITEDRISEWKKQNDLQAGMIDTAVNYWANAMGQFLQIETDTNNKVLQAFTGFINAMIAELTRYIAKMAIAAILKQIVFGVSSGGSGILAAMAGSGLIKGTNAQPPNIIVNASNNSTQLLSSVSRLNKNIENMMNRPVNVYVDPSDIARASQLGNQQRVVYA